MDRCTTRSDAQGLTQGYYDTTALPVYQYLHSDGAPKLIERASGLQPLDKTYNRDRKVSDLRHALVVGGNS